MNRKVLEHLNDFLWDHRKPIQLNQCWKFRYISWRLHEVGRAFTLYKTVNSSSKIIDIVSLFKDNTYSIITINHVPTDWRTEECQPLNDFLCGIVDKVIESSKETP